MATNYNGFFNRIANTHTYVSANKDTEGAMSYVQKGTGHMVYASSWEPQRTNNFELVIEGLDRLYTANIDTGDIPTGTNTVANTDDSGYNKDSITPPSAAERIMLSVDSFTAPSIEIAQITTQYGNNSIKWAGKPEFPNSTITVNDYIGIQVERILAAWFRCAYDFKTEKIGLARHYKKTGYLIEYDPKGGTARCWRLDGLWLASFNLGEWSQEGNAQRKIQATLVYDRVVPDYGVEDDNNPYSDWKGTEADSSENTSALNSATPINPFGDSSGRDYYG